MRAYLVEQLRGLGGTWDEPFVIKRHMNTLANVLAYGDCDHEQAIRIYVNDYTICRKSNIPEMAARFHALAKVWEHIAQELTKERTHA